MDTFPTYCAFIDKSKLTTKQIKLLDNKKTVYSVYEYDEKIYIIDIEKIDNKYEMCCIVENLKNLNKENIKLLRKLCVFLSDRQIEICTEVCQGGNIECYINSNKDSRFHTYTGEYYNEFMGVYCNGKETIGYIDEKCLQKTMKYIHSSS